MEEKIKLCAECGRPFETQWYERYCPECNKKFELEELLETAAAGEEIYCGRNPICPWCGEEYEADFEDPDYFRDGSFVAVCPECGKEYWLSVSISCSYDAKRDLPGYILEDRRRTEEARKNYTDLIAKQGGKRPCD